MCCVLVRKYKSVDNCFAPVFLSLIYERTWCSKCAIYNSVSRACLLCIYIYIYLSGVDARVSLVDSARSGAQKHLDEHAQNVAPLESAAALLLGRLRFSI